MCCNYCYHFKECKKAKKAGSKCCPECAEREFCPFVLGEAETGDLDTPIVNEESDIDIFGEEGFQ